MTLFFLSLSLPYSICASLFSLTAIRLQYPPPPPQHTSIIPHCDPVANQFSSWLSVKKPQNRPFQLFQLQENIRENRFFPPPVSIRCKGLEVSAVNLPMNALSKGNVPGTLVLPSDKKDKEMLTRKFKLNIITNMVNECTTNIVMLLWMCCVSRNPFIYVSIQSCSTHPLFHTVFTCYCARHCSLCCTTVKRDKWSQQSLDIEQPFRLKVVCFRPAIVSRLWI